MAFWLVKQEPNQYAWDNFVADGSTVWEGVRNYAARIHLNTMQVGDYVFYYHSNIGKEIVGIACVTRAAFPDPSSSDPQWVAVELSAHQPLKQAVSLERIKQTPELAQMALIKISRLSVMPVTNQEFQKILEMSGTLLLENK